MDAQRVFVTNFAGHDYSYAESRYGKLEFITKGYISFHSLDRMQYLVIDGMKDTTSEDWLLLSGLPVICVIAAIAWYHKHNKVKLLIHDKQNNGKYRELIITDDNVTKLLEVVADQTKG